jgi:hypothetical protein
MQDYSVFFGNIMRLPGGCEDFRRNVSENEERRQPGCYSSPRWDEKRNDGRQARAEITECYGDGQRTGRGHVNETHTQC